MNRNWLWVVFFILVLSACKKQIIPQVSTHPESNSVSSDSLRVDVTDFTYFSSKSEFNYKDDDENISATATLRVKRDSIIWVNISPGLGIEAIRSIITPDSIVVVDKIKKQFVVYHFADLSKRYNFPIDFNLIQSLLFGNLIQSRTSFDRINKEASYFLLSQKVGKSIIESYVNETTHKVDRVLFSEPGTTNLLSADYGSFNTDESGKTIPNKISIDLDYFFEQKKYNVSIDVSHQKTEFQDKGLKFPFNIPAKYERKD